MSLSSSNQSWSARIKLTLIPVLAVILVALVVWPPESEETTETPATALAKEADRVQKRVQVEDRQLIQAWSRVDARLAGRFNPFAALKQSKSLPADTKLPDQSGESTITGRAESEPNDAVVVRVKVDAVHEVRGVFSALVDGQVVRVGDTLSDNRRCVAISQAGVVLETPLTQTDDHPPEKQ